MAEQIEILVEIRDLLRTLVRQSAGDYERQPADPESPARDPRLERIATLEKQLVDLEPGVRARAIQQRLGLTRTTYYRLRMQLVSESHESHKSHG